MNKVLASAMVITMALALFLGVFFFGAVDPEVAAPMYFAALAAISLWGGKLLLSPAATWKGCPMNWPVLAFGMYAFLRYFTSPVEFHARVELLYVVLYVLTFFTASQFYRPTDRTVVLVTLLILAAFQGTYALWQFSTKSDAVLFWERPEIYQGRGGGTYVCPNSLAGFLELALGILLASGILMNRRKGSVELFTIQRLIFLYVAIMALVGIGVSLSRGGWIATLAGLAMLALWGNWRSRFSWGRAAAVVVGIVVLGGLVWVIAPARVMKAFTVTDKSGSVSLGVGDQNLSSRRFLWSATLPIIREHPVFGTGVGSWQWVHLKHRRPEVPTHTDYTHNDYLNLLSDYGVVGFVLLLWLFIGFFQQAAKASDARLPSAERSFSVGTVMGVAAILVHSLMDFNMHVPGNAFVLAVLMGCTAAIADPDQRFPRIPMRGWSRVALGIGLLTICSILGWMFTSTAMGARYTRLGNAAKFDSSHIFEPDTALNFYKRAIAADPGSATPHWQIGEIYRNQAQWRLGEEKKAERVQLARQALPFYAEALRLNSYLTQVWLRAAAAHELAGDDERALEQYRRAVEVEPNSPVVHERIGKFYRDRGNKELATKHYEIAQRLKWVSSSGIDWNVEELREK